MQVLPLHTMLQKQFKIVLSHWLFF